MRLPDGRQSLPAQVSKYRLSQMLVVIYMNKDDALRLLSDLMRRGYRQPSSAQLLHSLVQCPW